MANFGNNVNLNKNQLLNHVVHLVSSDPVGGALTEGLFWYNTVSHVLKYYDGTVVVTLSSSTGLTQEQVEDIVGAMVSGNTETNIAVTYDDTNGKLDFVVGSTYTDEMARDAIGTALVAGNNIDITVNDAGDTITIDVESLTSGDITDFAEAVSDQLGAMVTTNTETGITVTYDDADNTLDFVLDNEYLQDTIGAMVTGGTESGITVSYDDTNARFDFTVTDSPLLGGNNSAYHLSRANHTGTQLFSTVVTSNTDRLLGRDTAAGGAVEEISLNSTLEFTGSSSIQRAALTGNVTAPAGSNTTTIASGVVTLAMHANMATDRLLGRDTAGSGAPEELTVTGGLEFTGTGIQRSALTGDITATAGSNTTAIAAGVIVDADVNASAAIAVTKLGLSTTDRLVGRDTAGSGAGEEITVTGGLEWTGSGGIQRSALTGDVTATAGSNTTAIAAGVIVDADVNASAAIAATKLGFTPTGNIAATTVQAAIAELETDLTNLIATTVEGQLWKDPVDAATTGVLPNTPTYNSGAGTLTAGANAAFPTTDGVAAVVGQSYLVKDQASTFQNGIYNLTTVGSGAAAWVLTRRTDANVFGELNDAAVMVEGGTTNIGRVYTQTSTLTNLTSDAQTWTLTNQNQVYTADGSTITLTANQFAVPAGGITGTQLNASVAGNGLTGGGGSALAVNTGTSSATLLEISSDTVRISTDAAGNGLTGGGGSALAVNTGTGLEISSDTVRIATSAAGNGLTGGGGSALALASSTGGAGLTFTTGVLAVGAGTGITVNADDVALAATVAGGGLTHTTGVLAVGAGNGITVNADDVALASSTAGGGLTYTTGVLAVGAGTGITVNADDIAVNTSVVVRKYATSFGDGSSVSYVITHNLGTRDVTVATYLDSGTYEEILYDVEHTSTNTVTIRTAVAPTTNQYRVVVHA